MELNKLDVRAYITPSVKSVQRRRFNGINAGGEKDR